MSRLPPSTRSLHKTFFTQFRAMATAPQKYEWMVIIPDHGGVLDKRMEVRPYAYPIHLSP